MMIHHWLFFTISRFQPYPNSQKKAKRVFYFVGFDARDGQHGWSQQSLKYLAMEAGAVLEQITASKDNTLGNLTLPMLRLLSSIKIFENHLHPVMLVFIGKLSLSTLK